MNAIEGATTVEMVGKIASVINLRRSRFLEVTVNLTPWLDPTDTRD